MKNKKSIYIIGIALFVITALVLVITSHNSKSFEIYTTSSSKAEDYAKKHNINYTYVTDSEVDYFTEKVEHYSYNIYEDGVEISKYDGISEELVLPAILDGKYVRSIAKDIFKDTKVKKIVLPYSLNNLVEDDFKDIELVCYNTDLCKKLKDNKDLKVNVLSDSDSYYYDATDIPFEYNIIGEEIQIAKYTGSSDSFIIPKSIDGYEVTSVKLDIAKNIKSLYIPSSVKDITLNDLNSGYNTLFWTILGLDLVILILFIIFTGILPYKSNKETFNSAPSIIVSTIYLLVMYGYSIYANSNQYDIKNVLLVLIITSIIYAILSLALIGVKKKIESHDEKIAKADTYVKDTLELLEDLDIDSYDSKTKKLYEEVKDLIKYSDPISNDTTKELEKEIQNRIKEGKDDLDYWKKTKSLIEKRNRLCKNTK